MTLRQEVEKFLENSDELTATQIAKHFDIDKKVILEDLRHIFRSVKLKQKKLVIMPAACNNCGFRFHKDIKIPSKCPNCNREDIIEPKFKIE